MATRSAAVPTARGTREGPAERLAEFFVLGGMATLAVGFVLPLAVTALPVWGALHAVRRRSWRVRGPALALCALPAPTALLWAYVALGADPAAVASGYVDAQLDATEAVVRAWPVADWTPLLGAYAGGRVALRRGRRGDARRPGECLTFLTPRLCSREMR